MKFINVLNSVHKFISSQARWAFVFSLRDHKSKRSKSADTQHRSAYSLTLAASPRAEMI